MTLTWNSAAKIAWRELQAAKAKFLFVIFSVAMGVAALTGVRGFSSSFEKTLLGEARTIMAADLSARMFHLPSPGEERQLNGMAAAGMDRTEITEMVSMASLAGDPLPLLITLKAVDPAKYPFYGEVSLDPAQNLSQALNSSTVVVAQDLLLRLHARVGDSLKIGNATFRIAAVLVREPDRMNSTMGLGPRVMMSRGGLDRSGLVQQGSRAGERFLFKLSPQGSGIAEARADLERVLPDAQITDFRETNPALTDGLNRATGLLSLICLVAMVLGAVGVGMAMRAHLQQRIEVLAIMKSIGARSSAILRIYLLQTLLLGFAGGLIGIFFGVGVQLIFPSLVGRYMPIEAQFHFPVASAIAGLATGMLTTVLFCLPPLLDIRKVRPSLVLRRTVESGSAAPGETAGVGGRILSLLRADKAQWIAAVVILAGLAAIAAALSDSAVVGRWFAAALAGLFAAILLVTAVTLRVVRAFLTKTRMSLQSSLRHGLANLYRPQNQSAAVLAALGLGVMLILTVFLMQRSVIGKVRMTASKDVPNVFLIDISSKELTGVESLLAQQPGVRRGIETLPVVAGRILAIDGTPVEKLSFQNYPRRLLQSVALTWSRDLPAGEEVVGGKWWGSTERGNLVAVSGGAAQRLHLRIGSDIALSVGEKTIHVRVATIIRQDGQHLYARSPLVLSPQPLAGSPVIWYAAVHVDPSRVTDLQRALFALYPTITVINIADILETIQSVIGQITMVVRFLAGFSILTGAIILASSIASTRWGRIREVVVLKTLGAKRRHIIAVFSVEFLVLGLLAGLVGVVFANLLSRVLLHRLDVVFQMDWTASLIAVVGTAVLAIATGWLASYRMLGHKPLEILREN